MRRLFLAVTLASALGVTPAAAQANLFGVASWGFLPAGQWTGLPSLYVDFVVSAGGTFTFETFGMQGIDPFIGVWCLDDPVGCSLASRSPILSDRGWSDDDSGTISGNFWNSKIVGYVDPGFYRLTLATGEIGGPGGHESWCDSDLDFSDCYYSWAITSPDGDARLASVPEPPLYVVLATGLLVMGLARRRRSVPHLE